MDMDSITSADMRALELNAEYIGVSRLQLMESAGASVAEEISKRFRVDGLSVTVYAGLGGNGGDGLVAARYLSNRFKVSVVLAGRPSLITDECVRRNFSCIEKLDSVDLYIVRDSSDIPRVSSFIAIDALLGTGAKGAPKEPIASLINEVNKAKFIVAVDVPSGVNANTGEVYSNCAVKAHLTVTFHKIKKGLLSAKEYTGEIVVKPIGIPKEAELYTGPGDVYLAKRKRKVDSHKGENGRVVIIGGSDKFTGAPALAGLAAYRVGVDLVYIIAPSRAADIIASYSPNFITVKLKSEVFDEKSVDKIGEILQKADSVILGCGLGLSDDVIRGVRRVLEHLREKNIPVVLDADGLKSFAKLKVKLPDKAVLTPHMGEFSALANESLEKDLSKRLKQVEKVARELKACVLLKGPVDIISDGEKVKINKTGNPGMTVGGTGDILAGICGGLLAHGFSPFLSACASAFINGTAGDLAVREKGYHIVPTDLLDYIPYVMENYERLSDIKSSTKSWR